jgi:uncharacterized protein
MMKKSTLLILFFFILLYPASSQPARYKVIAFYTTTVESDHVDFARDALAFFSKLSKERDFEFDSTSDWSNINAAFLSGYQLVLWLNDFPKNEQQRLAFQQYMDQGGAWLGFHVSGYNDKHTKWPWFVDFLGGAVFYMNNWPPLPAKLVVDDQHHPVTANMPQHFIAPINEWYQWLPSPRLSKDVHVLVSLDSSNFPIGKKNLIPGGDVPVVWTNTHYRMLYMNMGHGDKIFTDSLQNQMFVNAIKWLCPKK